MAEKEVILDIDQGYAWVIAGAGFAWNVIIVTIAKTFGVMHIQLQELFGEHAFKTSLVAFIYSLMWLLLSPVGGYMAYKWSYRITVSIGTVLSVGKSLKVVPILPK